jgi:hypothetical protein
MMLQDILARELFDLVQTKIIEKPHKNLTIMPKYCIDYGAVFDAELAWNSNSSTKYVTVESDLTISLEMYKVDNPTIKHFMGTLTGNHEELVNEIKKWI